MELYFDNSLDPSFDGLEERYAHIMEVAFSYLKVEKNFEDNLDVIEEAAKSLYRKSPDYAAKFLTEYSVNKARATVERWQLLGQFLLVKYTDGVVKKERNGRFIDNGEGVPELILQPGYSDWFYRQIVKETGDRYRLPDEFQGKQLK